MSYVGKDIVVVGAGVVGLSTALSIQEAFPESNVTIIADKFNDETLSSGAAGIFRPEINVHPDADLVRKWCQVSLDHFLKITNSPDGAAAGMELVSGYHLSSSTNSIQNDLLKELVPEYRNLNEKELKLFPEHFKSGTFFTTIVADCRYYLPWMKMKFEIAGGKIEKKHISNLSELSEGFDFIINCTGLCPQLLQDDMLVSVRGQTIKVKAPWIKNFYYGDGVYILPGVDYVTLGGIKDYGCWNTEVNSYQKQFIWDKCTELVPSLKNAEFAWDWVGLRPFRPSVRVDVCFVNCNGKHRMVVNNYGHGGHGVALSWGTAQEVVGILKKLPNKNTFTVAKL